MLLRGGPHDGEKTDGRRARGLWLVIRSGDELAHYRRSQDGRYFDFERLQKLTAAEVERLDQIARRK